jgi:hypothetical protein
MEKERAMPSNQYFEELTAAVLTDVDALNGFSTRQSPEQIQQLTEDISERIAETFAQLLEAEMEEAGKLQELQGRMEGVSRALRESLGMAEVERAILQVEELVQATLPAYDAFLLKAGLRIRKAFVEALTKA